MKNLSKFFVLMAATVIAFAACTSEEEFNQEEPVVEVPTLHINVTAVPDAIMGDAQTKTYVDGTSIFWGTGEYMKIGVYDGTATTFGNSSDSTADMWDGDKEAMFTFDITPANASGDYTYYGLYPKSAAVSNNNDNPANYKVNLPSTQNATASSYDPKAYILVAQPEDGKTVAAADWIAAFRRATALNKLTLRNLPEDIKRVTVTAPSGTYLAGARHIDLTTGVSGDIYNGGGRTETVEVKFASKQSHASDIIVWFTSWNAEIPVDGNLTIVAFSDAHTYTRTLTVVNKPISFKEGYLNTLNVNMTSAIEGANTELEDGDYVILAKNGDDYYAVTAALNGNHIASTDYTGSTSSYLGDVEYIWTVTKSDDSYIFENDGKYIGYKGSSNEAYWLEPDASWTEDNYLLDVVWDGVNSCYNVTLHSNSERKFSRNSGSDYFAFYTSDQQKNIVFVPASVDNRTVVYLSFTEDSIDKTTANYDEFTGQTATASPNETDITEHITYAISGDAIGTVNASTGVVSLNGDAGTATVTASFAGDVNYRPAVASYTIIVATVSGPQYEKVTSLSNVTAGEYIIVNDGYYLPNDAATSSSPAKVAVTISADKVQSVTDAMKWTFSGSSSAMTIQSKADDDYYLLVNGTGNSSLRVSTTSHTWTIADYAGTAGAFTMKDNTNNRYCASYGAGSDWRSYNTYNAGNYGDGGRVYLYKLVDNRPEPGMAWSSASATATYNNGNSLSFGAPSLDPGDATGITYSSSDETIATIDALGEVTITALSGNDVKEGSTTISAIFAGDASYKAQTVSYTLTVADGRDAVSTPGFDTAAGEVAANTVVSFTCADGGVTYYYTENGSEPTTASSSGASVTIDVAKTVKVIATKTGYKPSSVAEAAYTVAGVSTTIADVISGGVGSYEVPDVLVYAVKGNGLIIGDGTAFIYTYKSSHGLSVGDVRTVNGSTQLYNSEVYQFNGPTFTGSGTSAVNHGVAIEFNDDADDLETSFTTAGNIHTAVYIHATGTQSGRNITTAGGDVLYLSANESETDGKSVEVYGYVYAYSSSHSNFNFLVTSIGIDPSVPSLTTAPADGSTIEWADDEYGVGNAQNISVTINGAATGYTVSSGNAAWTVSDNGSGTITVYPNAANESTTDDKTLDVTITHNDNGGLTSTITLKQNKQSGGGADPTIDTITSGTFSGDTNSLAMTTAAGVTITQLKGVGSNCNTTYNTVSTLRVYRGNQMKFTGKTFTRIEMCYTGSYSGVDWSVVAGGGSVSIDTANKKVIWVNAGGASTVTLQNSTASGTNTQLRTTQFIVTYN